VRVAYARVDATLGFYRTLVGFAGIARSVERLDPAAHENACAGRRWEFRTTRGKGRAVVTETRI
jgi:hypothetical protein